MNFQLPAPPLPTSRALRGYAYDPSLATVLETSTVSEMTYRCPWEENLQAGPIGEYIEVVDYDPASGCFYAPVDLNHPNILAQDGLSPSEGNPQFHQQMVYAVAMTTIDHFEKALGRKTFWADRLPSDDKNNWSNAYVPRLRIYPHALRSANAYYSRQKGAILCGYFPATEDRTSGQLPGGMVFTCLSHDIVAHEVTHALLDGFHEYFMEASNPDVLAFHEAFADIVAIFRHFSFPEVLEHQIAKTRGDLGSENLLAQLAGQFGLARGNRGALRDAIGSFDKSENKWVRRTPDVTELDRTTEVHARGAILVGAVFDAFLSIYRTRTKDLFRLASNGTGVLPVGDLHPDLVRRLAQESAKAASHVLNMCIRALDYCPPVDLTFGEYLRALITADMDLMSADQHGYRVAFIEAFRRRGIYPRDVRTLSEDSLRWSQPGEDPTRGSATSKKDMEHFITEIKLRAEIEKLRYLKDRGSIWFKTRQIRKDLHTTLLRVLSKAKLLQELTGLALTGYKVPEGVPLAPDGAPKFYVSAIREAHRQKEDGRVLNQVFMTIVQENEMPGDGRVHKIRCGSTLVLDLDQLRVTYVITKGLEDKERLMETMNFQIEQSTSNALASTYFGGNDEIFAALHNPGS